MSLKIKGEPENENESPQYKVAVSPSKEKENTTQILIKPQHRIQRTPEKQNKHQLTGQFSPYSAQNYSTESGSTETYELLLNFDEDVETNASIDTTDKTTKIKLSILSRMVKFTMLSALVPAAVGIYLTCDIYTKICAKPVKREHDELASKPVAESNEPEEANETEEELEEANEAGEESEEANEAGGELERANEEQAAKQPGDNSSDSDYVPNNDEESEEESEDLEIEENLSENEDLLAPVNVDQEQELEELNLLLQAAAQQEFRCIETIKILVGLVILALALYWQSTQYNFNYVPWNLREEF